MGKLEIPGKLRPYVMAHRGNLVHCPENTLAAFQRAVDDGADVIETDLHVTADGHFVCIHDDAVDRTTNGRGAVRDMTLAQIKALSAGAGWPEYADERVPTLDEVFALVPAGIVVALELKADDFLAPETGQRLVAAIAAAGRSDGVVLLSFTAARVQAVKQQGEAAGCDLPAGYITYTRLVPKGGVELLGPAWPLLFLNPLYVLMAHWRGQPVCPLDPTPDKRLWYYKLLGCDAVLTNDPGATQRALGRS